MNQAWMAGFVKAAVDQGITDPEAIEQLVKTYHRIKLAEAYPEAFERGVKSAMPGGTTLQKVKDYHNPFSWGKQTTMEKITGKATELGTKALDQVKAFPKAVAKKPGLAGASALVGAGTVAAGYGLHRGIKALMGKKDAPKKEEPKKEESTKESQISMEVLMAALEARQGQQPKSFMNSAKDMGSKVKDKAVEAGTWAVDQAKAFPGAVAKKPLLAGASAATGFGAGVVGMGLIDEFRMRKRRKQMELLMAALEARQGQQPAM